MMPMMSWFGGLTGLLITLLLILGVGAMVTLTFANTSVAL
jgi:hypothetical protein